MEWWLKRLTEELEFRGYSRNTINFYKSAISTLIKNKPAGIFTKTQRAAVSFLLTEIIVRGYEFSNRHRVSRALPEHLLENSFLNEVLQ